MHMLYNLKELCFDVSRLDHIHPLVILEVLSYLEANFLAVVMAELFPKERS